MENVLVDRAPVRLRRPARLLRLASDDRLVALVRAGDEGAFEALYDRHHPAILGFCRHMLGTREEAEDAVQHTFLSAFRDLAGSDKPIELRPWLFAIARNRCISLLRARREHVAIELAQPATDGLAATVERREDLRELLTDLARLPEDQRAALLLAELGALDHAEIATVLDCPREKVKALVFQARTSLAASREARSTPCDEIRLELATASGAALRRGPLRRHLRACDGCRAFKAEVATQRKLLALALPVVPSIVLKTAVLSGGSGASASGGGAVAAATATTTGAVTTGSGGALGGVIGAVASTGAGKATLSLAVAGVMAGGGALTERIAHHRPAPSTVPSTAQPGAPSAPRLAPLSVFEQSAAESPGATAPSAPADAPGHRPARGGGATAPSEAKTPAGLVPAHDGRGHGMPAERMPSHAPPARPVPPTPAEDVRRDGAPAPQAPAPPPQAQGRSPGGAPPTNGRAPPPAPGSAAPDSPAPSGGKPSDPGAASGTPSPPARALGKASASAPPPGRPASPPGRASSTPASTSSPPGKPASPPGRADPAPGRPAAPPGRADPAPGRPASPASTTPPPSAPPAPQAGKPSPPSPASPASSPAPTPGKSGPERSPDAGPPGGTHAKPSTSHGPRR